MLHLLFIVTGRAPVFSLLSRRPIWHDLIESDRYGELSFDLGQRAE